MDQKEYWDSVSESKKFSTPFQMELFREHVSPDMKVLDVGCGYGRTMRELDEAGYKDLTGVDFSQGMIEQGKALYPHLNLMRMQGETLPFADGSFDAVVLLAVLTCIVSEEEQARLMKEIERVLRDGGLVFVNDFLINEDKRNTERYEKYAKIHGQYGVFELPEGAFLRHHTVDYVKKLMKSFQQLAFETVVYTTMNGNKSNGFYCVGRKEQG